MGGSNEFVNVLDQAGLLELSQKRIESLGCFSAFMQTPMKRVRHNCGRSCPECAIFNSLPCLLMGDFNASLEAPEKSCRLQLREDQGTMEF